MPPSSIAWRLLSFSRSRATRLVEEVLHLPLGVADVGVDLDVQLLRRLPCEQAPAADLEDHRHVGRPRVARKGATSTLRSTSRRGAALAMPSEASRLFSSGIELLERPRRVVAGAVRQAGPRRQLRLDPQPVVGAVGLEVRALEGQHVGDAGALEHPLEGLAQVVGVLEQLAAGLVGEKNSDSCRRSAARCARRRPPAGRRCRPPGSRSRRAGTRRASCRCRPAGWCCRSAGRCRRARSRRERRWCCRPRPPGLGGRRPSSRRLSKPSENSRTFLRPLDRRSRCAPSRRATAE